MGTTSLTTWLMRLHTHDQNITLAYHPTITSHWERCTYLGQDYDGCKPYNHRSILKNEIVIEFDEKEETENATRARKVEKKLEEDKIPYSKWKSGNKSIHLHVIINPKENEDVTLLKKIFMKHYTEGIGVPDLQLAIKGHLIRAEYGVHEKTGRKKQLIYASPEYPASVEIPETIVEKYHMELRRQLNRPIFKESIKHLPAVKHLISAVDFKENKDGHERALWMLIQILKKDFQTIQEAEKYFQGWYTLSGGTQLSKDDVKRKVKYHWNKDYTISASKINELLESLGRTDLFIK